MNAGHVLYALDGLNTIVAHCGWLSLRNATPASKCAIIRSELARSSPLVTRQSGLRLNARGFVVSSNRQGKSSAYLSPLEANLHKQRDVEVNGKNMIKSAPLSCSSSILSYHKRSRISSQDYSVMCDKKLPCQIKQHPNRGPQCTRP